MAKCSIQESLVQAVKETHSPTMLRKLYRTVQDTPYTLKHWPGDWAVAIAWEILPRVVAKYSPHKSKKGFRSYFIQCLRYACVRAWRDEDVIRIPVNQRAKVKHVYLEFEGDKPI